MRRRDDCGVLVSVPSQIGYAALVAFVFAESAGVPIPGETALITAGLLAGDGRLSLPVVIAVAAGAAMLGDNVGYVVGRRGGRRVLLREGRFSQHRRKAVVVGDRFFARHGAKAVFFGRWVSGVRIVAALMAGASHMPWRTFALFNAAGAICWAATIAGIAALLGPVAIGAVYLAGVVAAGGAAATLGGRLAWRRRKTAAYRDATEQVVAERGKVLR